MADAGRRLLISKNSVIIAGAQQNSLSVNNSPVDITAIGDGGYRRIDDEPGIRSIDLSISGLWFNTTFRNQAVSTDLLLTDITVEFADGGSLSGDFYLADYEETGAHDGAVAFNASMQSSAAWTYNSYNPTPTLEGWDISTATFNRGAGYFDLSQQTVEPHGVFFKPDGTKMYVVEEGSNNVLEYDLSSAWDVSTASYLHGLLITEQEPFPTDIFFKPDGTKMYITGRGNDGVYEYDLGVAWDISSASYLQNFSVSGQETQPEGLFFKPDGTKMYITGPVGDDVNEYDLSVAWDISSASYLQNFSVAAQETVPVSLTFKSDGTKMYVGGQTGDDINEYDLSVAWDISTAVYLQNFSDSAFSSPQGVTFKSDGTKMYIACTVTDAVWEYDLSVAWDISTATLPTATENYFSVASEDTQPRALFFKSDGTKMYVVGDFGNAVYEYDLSVAWDASTAVYLQNFSVGAQEGNPAGLFFKPDGTKMYITGYTGDDVNEYDLSSAWDVSTAVYLQNFSVSAQGSLPVGLFFKPDGTKMYVVDYSNDSLNEYDLSSAWDVSTSVYLQTLPTSPQGVPYGVFFKPDGAKLYITGSSPDAVSEYDLGVAWDISTAKLKQVFAFPINIAVDPQDLFFKPDGTKLYIISGSDDSVWSFDLAITPEPAAWNLAGFSGDFGSVGYLSVVEQDGNPTGVTFKPDGTKMYIAGTLGDSIYEYDLGTAWDISSASYLQSLNVAAQDGVPEDLFFKPDGTKMYVIGSSGDAVYEYDLSSAWDISTASYLQSFSVATQETSPSGLFFKSDGTKMYITGTSGDDVNEYDLSSAWDISTASYLQNFSVSAQESAPESLFFKPDGTKMYVLGSSGDDVNEYDLSVAWDISSASYLQTFSFQARDFTPGGLSFKPDGTKMYFVGSSTDALYEYDLSVAWDISTALWRAPTQDTFDVRSQETDPTGVAFKSDGTKMYVVGTADDDIDEYDLSTAWDVTSASHLQTNTLDGTFVEDLFFKDDGTKLYILERGGDYVYEYDLSSAWDISSKSAYVSRFRVFDQDATPYGLFFKPDGTKMFVAGSANDAVYQYTLSTPWDISTATFVNGIGIARRTLTPTALSFKSDGTVMYVADAFNAAVIEYALSTAWDVTTISYSRIGKTFFVETSPEGLFFKPDGNEVFVVGSVLGSVMKYDLVAA